MTYWKPTRPVLMTADPIGGVWTYVIELCRELAKAQVKVALATMGRRLTSAERDAVSALENVELFESEYKLEWMHDPWKDIEAAGKWLLEIQSRVQPSLVHLNQYCYGVIRWPVPCLMVGHSCVFSWYEAVKGGTPPAEWDRYKQALTIGLRGADLVTAPTRFMLAALKRHYGNFSAADPIYNGRDASRFTRRNKEDFILTAGRLWDEAKNVEILDGIAGRLPWPVLAAGPLQSPEGKRIHLHALKHLGELDSAALADRLARASVFVLPARYEPFGFTALEASLCGCVPVLGDIPSLREIWDGAALFVPPHDDDKILTALLQLIDDAPARADLARRAHERAASFTAQKMAEGYLALYERLLSSQAKPLAADTGPAGEG